MRNFSVVLLFVLVGCVDGKLDPRVAPVVSALDVAACSVVDVFVSDRRVGAVCQGVVPLVNSLLTAISASRQPGLLRAPTLPIRVPVYHKGVTIGHVDADVAPLLQAKLDEVR